MPLGRKQPAIHHVCPKTGEKSVGCWLLSVEHWSSRVRLPSLTAYAPINDYHTSLSYTSGCRQGDAQARFCIERLNVGSRWWYLILLIS